MREHECKCLHEEDDEPDNRDVRIVILQRGWVFVGVLTKKNTQYTLSQGFNIRHWGTSKGLGELVNGPLQNTKLDPIPDTEFHELTVVAMLKVNAAKWKLKK